MTAETAGQFGLDHAQGIVAAGVAVGSAAAKAEIMQDDVILKIGGSTAQNLSILTKVAAVTSPGQSVPIEISRHGKRQQMSLLVDQRRR